MVKKFFWLFFFMLLINSSVVSGVGVTTDEEGDWVGGDTSTTTASDGTKGKDSVEAFVTRFYQEVLGREPDSAGLKGWVNSLKTCSQTGADVANDFVFSKEFINKRTSNEKFVTILYKAFFDRDPDTGGYMGWTNKLYGGATRKEVLNGFIFSQEFKDLCDAYDIWCDRSKPSPCRELIFCKSSYGCQEGYSCEKFGLRSWGYCKLIPCGEPFEEEWAECGKCGYSLRLCGNDNRWAGWSECYDQGVCKQGEVKKEKCGNEGSRSQECNYICEWESQSECVGEGNDVFDWRNKEGKNWMTPVKDQGSCGSCWSFSALGAVEGAYNVQQNNPNLDLDLAEQELVSCNGGGTCSGGWPSLALNYIKTNGILTETCFPYKTSDVSCTTKKCNEPKYKINSYESTTDFNRIKQILKSSGPLSICLRWRIKFDENGVGKCMDTGWSGHAITLVGYNDPGDYWIIKNSWGADWNDDGYAKIGYLECDITKACDTYGMDIPKDEEEEWDNGP